MNYHCEKLCWITLFVAMMMQHCWCSSAIRLMETPEEQHVPRVTCSDRRIRAVFGPLVRSNVHVKGESALYVAGLYFPPVKCSGVSQSKSTLLSIFQFVWTDGEIEIPFPTIPHTKIHKCIKYVYPTQSTDTFIHMHTLR